MSAVPWRPAKGSTLGCKAGGPAVGVGRVLEVGWSQGSQDPGAILVKEGCGDKGEGIGTGGREHVSGVGGGETQALSFLCNLSSRHSLLSSDPQTASNTTLAVILRTQEREERAGQGTKRGGGG